jgi:hypothetical protein
VTAVWRSDAPLNTAAPLASPGRPATIRQRIRIMSLSRRLARLEKLVGEAPPAGPTGILVTYEVGQPPPDLNEAQTRAVARGAAVLYIPHNGREPLAPVRPP